MLFRRSGGKQGRTGQEDEAGMWSWVERLAQSDSVGVLWGTNCTRAGPNLKPLFLTAVQYYVVGKMRGFIKLKKCSNTVIKCHHCWLHFLDYQKHSHLVPSQSACNSSVILFISFAYFSIGLFVFSLYVIFDSL